MMKLLRVWNNMGVSDMGVTTIYFGGYALGKWKIIILGWSIPLSTLYEPCNLAAI